jgi:hypothetical protein
MSRTPQRRLGVRVFHQAFSFLQTDRTRTPNNPASKPSSAGGIKECVRGGKRGGKRGGGKEGEKERQGN